MTHQYIGARYIPKFDGAYNPNKIYEALVIVEFNDSSYTSKKPVPAGISPLNTEYWALSGTTSGQIRDLQERLSTVEEEIGVLNILENRRFVFIGDSYDVVTATSWIDRVATFLGISNYVKVSVGGYGFYRDGIHTWESLLESTSINNPETVTDIVICGGANDRGVEASTLRLAMQSFNAYIHSRFINLSNVYLGYNCWTSNFGNVVTKECYINYMRLAPVMGWSRLRNLEYVLHNLDLISEDALHPTIEGVEELALKTADAILNGSTDVEFSYTTEYQIDSTYADNKKIIVSGKTVNGMTTLSFRDLDFVSKAQMSSNLVIAHCVNNKSVIQHNDAFIPFTGLAVNGQTYIPLNGFFSMENGTDLKIWFRGRTSQVIPTGSTVIINPASTLTIPTMDK